MKENELSSWILRFEFDRDIMMRKNIYMIDIQEIILEHCPSANDSIQCTISDDNSGNLIMRMRIKCNDNKSHSRKDKHGVCIVVL